ncbi:hypothetical protein WMY93_017767 [Mugilogobius chulae]|uniref:Uncharacterized protein n=1 Tax=Mugilogobius chulae TaxID=88201 RepID=A0AAW0NP49_9GOBI
MLESLCCKTCLAPLQPEDGHELCPSCLGIDHLKEGLSDTPCMNCGIMPRAVREARLATIESAMGLQQTHPQTDQTATRKRTAGRSSATLTRKRAKTEKHSTGLSVRVDSLSSELAQMKSLLQSMQAATQVDQAGGPFLQEDAMSVAASDSQFQDLDSVAEDSGSLFCEPLPGDPDVVDVESRASSYSVGDGDSDHSAVSAIRTALARLQLDAQPVQTAASSAFFRRQSSTASFVVPPSEEYIKELHACWADTRLFSRPTADGRALASMQDAPKFGLGHMPSVESTVASLIVSPDEALRPNARCPRPQCRITDELLCRAYDAGARMGRTGNSLSHLLLGLASSLETAGIDAPTQGLVDTSLQAFAFMSRELGRLLSILTQVRRQVWLAQSPLTDNCRRTLRALPVIPGELFGSTALEALQRTAQASQTRQQLAGLHRRAPSRPSTPAVARGSYPSGQTSFMARRPVARPGPFRSERSRSQAPYGFRSAQPDRQPPRPSRGRGGRKLWVLTTLSQGYRLQFRRRPPAFGRVRWTVIHDSAKAQALCKEISTLLEKGAIVPVDPRLDPGGFYSRYFLVPKKTGDLRPVLDLRGLNVFLKVLQFRM